MLSQLLFRGCWSEEPLERRRHSQTSPGQNLMRNRGAAGPGVESGGGGGGRGAGGGCAELCGL